MFLSPSLPRRIASPVKRASNPLPQRSANGQEIQVPPGPIHTRGSVIALPSTQTPTKSSRSLSSQLTARHGTRITGVTFAAIQHFLRQARSVLRLAYRHICPLQAGRLLQRSKISGIDLDVTSILLVLDANPQRTASLPGLSPSLTDPISGRLYRTDFPVPRLDQGC